MFTWKRKEKKIPKLVPCICYRCIEDKKSSKSNNNNMREVFLLVLLLLLLRIWTTTNCTSGWADKLTMAFGGHVESKAFRMCQIFVVQSHFIYFFRNEFQFLCTIFVTKQHTTKIIFGWLFMFSLHQNKATYAFTSFKSIWQNNTAWLCVYVFGLWKGKESFFFILNRKITYEREEQDSKWRRADNTKV